MKLLKTLVGCITAVCLASTAIAQSEDETEDQPPLSSANFEAFSLRSIGPAFMSGRIADIEIMQDDPAT